ncbi:MAG: hypothetical protein HYT98_05110 [Candidatus Sungbacteria bacterium]|nr:hypothetical protein [Candidatus Sungbacteria bacterium]
MKKGINKNVGFGLIEVVIVTSIIMVSLFGFLQAGISAVRLLRVQKENLELTLLAGEAAEAMRAIRDESWTNNVAPLAASTPYYPILENGKWKLASSPSGLINGKYSRYIYINDVYRDALDKIAASGGTLDANTKKITAVATSTSKTVSIVSYITNFRESLSPTVETKTIFFEGSTTDGNLANFPSNDAGDGDPAQTFTTAGVIEVSSIELYLRRTTMNPSDIYAELRPSPTGSILGASQIITGSTISSTTYSWVSFRFPDPIALSAATQYSIRLRSIPPSTDAGSGSFGIIRWGYLQTASSPYAGGDARRYVGRLSNPADAGQLLDQYDYGFRVYDLQ